MSVHRNHPLLSGAVVMGAGGLRRQIGLATAIAVVIGNVIGSGIFTTSGFIARDVGSVLLLIGLWLVGGLIALAGALCYGELGAAMPHAGGEYVFLREAYGPMLAYLSGWTSFFIGFSGGIAAALLACSSYLHSLIPELGTTPMADKIVALSALWTITAVHAAGGTGLVAQRLLGAMTVVAIGGFILAGFLFGHGASTNFASSALPRGSAEIALIFVLFAYSGWNSSAYLAGELRNPEHDLPRSLLVGTGVVMVLYLSINALYVYALPIATMSAVLPVAEKASQVLFGVNAAKVVAAMIALCLLGSASASVLAGPRVYYAMARDGLWPRVLAEVHRGSGIPVPPIVLQSVWTSVLIMIFGVFERLIIYTGFALTIFAGLAVAAVIVLRLRYPQIRRPFMVPWYPWLPIAYLIATTWIALYTVWNRPQESVLGFLVVATGIPFYLTRSRHRLPRTIHMHQQNC